MGRISSLFAFGLGFIGAGFYWKLNEDIITNFISSFIRDTSDKYYLLSDLVWDALPFIVILLGIVCLVLGSMSNSSVQGGE